MEPVQSKFVAIAPELLSDFSPTRETLSMKLSRLATIAILASALMVSACANTIKGVGKDAANTVNATESAGKSVANAVN
jgi:entericidin B